MATTQINGKGQNSTPRHATNYKNGIVLYALTNLNLSSASFKMYKLIKLRHVFYTYIIIYTVLQRCLIQQDDVFL